MTSTPARGAESVRGAPVRSVRARPSVSPALIILLVGGLALRFAIAYLFFPQSGFSTDLSSYAAWANTLAQYGPAGFYANAGFADYPPGYLLLLWPIGLIAQSGGLGMATEDLIKIPPILIDVAVGLVLYLLVKGWARPRGWRWAERAALAAAAIYLFNPVTWYDSALWGQTDAAGALVILLGVAALIRGNTEGAAALAVVAAMVKPQFGVVLIPLVGVVLLKRHLFDPGSGPIHRPLVGGRIGEWLVSNQGPARIGTAFLVAWFVFFAMAIPFGMGPYEYLTFVSKTAGGYPYLTVNGYNLWALIGSEGNGSLASDGLWSKDTIPLLGPLPGVVIGGVLLLAGFVVGLWAAFRRDNRPTILIAAVVLSAAFFVLPTRVHERYLFPVFALLPILAVWSGRWRWATLAFAIGSFINLHAILTNANPQYGTDNVANLPFGDLFRTFPFVGLAVVLQTGAFLFAVWQLRGARGGLEQLVETPAQRHDGLATVPAIAPPIPGPGWPAPAGKEWGAPAFAAALPRPEGDSLYAAEADAGAEAAELSATEEAAALTGQEDDSGTEWAGLGTWIDGKLGTLRPVRRDRSAELTVEPAGRFDRVDALILVLLTVGSLALRAWHLDQPKDMYFDEVYHARTATEFLQDWRYGIVHSIYEYTHPHIAKYAMALGIEAFGDNKVVSTTQLDGPVSDAAIETRWSPAGLPAERDGDRLYVVNGTDLRVYDLATRQLITTIPLDKPATAVAVNDDGHQLYIASDDGTISQLDTTDLDALRTDPSVSVDAPTPILTLTGTTGDVVQLVVVDDQLVARTSDGWLAAIDPANAVQTGTLHVPGAVKAVRVPATDQVVVDQTKVTNLEEEAGLIATALADTPSRIRPLLQGTSTRVGLSGYLSDTDRTAIQKDMDAGKLPGVTIESGPVVAVSDPQGVSFLDAASLGSLSRMTIEGASGMALVDRGFDNPVLYLAADGTGGPQLIEININDTGPATGRTLQMPGLVHDVVWNEPANLVHVIGQTSDGKPTIYVVEPHAESVYADAQLPFTPQITLADTQRDRPESDRSDLLALSPDGSLAVVDIGQNAFAWRFPGVIMGTVMLVCIYLLARFLFRRRSVALFAAALGLVGGMFFANARIAMNDTYVAGFMMAALTVFVPLYMGLWRRRWQVILGLFAVGILLGLALASKWVGAYAIGGIALLVLLRSALGRIIALMAMITLTAVLGALAVRAPDVPSPHVDVFFLGLMLVLTVALAVAMVRRPVRMTMAELRFAVFAPAVAGIVLIAGSLAFASHLPDSGLFSARAVSLAGAAALLLSAGSYALAWLASRRGRGPLARRRVVPPDEPIPSPAPTGWLLPGHAGGIPWLYAFACLSVVPIAVYIISYIPWFNLGNQLIDGIPGRPHRPDAVAVDALDVRLPQQPASGPPGVFALVGLAPGSQTRLVLPGGLRQQHHGGHLRRGEPRHRVAGHSCDDLHGLGGVAAAQPLAHGHRGDVPGHVVAVVAHRSGHLPVPRLYQPAVRGAGAGLLPGRAMARAIARRLAVCSLLGGCGDPRAAPALAGASSAVHHRRLCRGPHRREFRAGGRLRLDHALDRREPGCDGLGGHPPDRRAGARLAALASLPGGRPHGATASGRRAHPG